MPHTSIAPASLRPSSRLTLLTALVVLVHWVVLHHAPLAWAAHESPQTPETRWAFSTRTIVLEQPAPSPARTTKDRTVSPARERTMERSTPDSTPVLGDVFKENTAVAHINSEFSATENIANLVTTESVASEPSVLLADAGSASSPAPAKSVSAKAVRSILVPPSAHLKYDIKGEVKGFPYQVRGDLRWAQDGKTYDARMEISHFLLGSRVQTSTGLLSRQGLEPRRFGDKVRSEVAAHFDYEKNKVTFSANSPEAPLLSGAQDQLSVLIQLAAMLGADPKAFPPGSTLPFQAVGPRSSETWVFNVGTTEKLQMPGGDMNAVRLWRDPNGEYDAKAEIWLAPDVGFLPVRIRLTQPNGDFVDQQWRETLK